MAGLDRFYCTSSQASDKSANQCRLVRAVAAPYTQSMEVDVDSVHLVVSHACITHGFAWDQNQKAHELAHITFGAPYLLMTTNTLKIRNLYKCTLVNSEDRLEMPHTGAFHQSLHCLLEYKWYSKKEKLFINYYQENQMKIAERISHNLYKN